jgi:hypothetical protein
MGALWNGIACAPPPSPGAPSDDPPPELVRIDDAIRATFLAKPYAGSAEDTLRQYAADAQIAQQFVVELERFARTCGSRVWTAAAVAQQGMIFDSLATKLDDATKNLPHRQFPAQVLLSNLQANQLRAIMLSGGAGARRDVEISAALELAILPYATAVDLARRYGLRGVDVDHARERLAHYTVMLGEQKMRAYVTNAKIVYRDGMYTDSTSAP